MVGIRDVELEPESEPWGEGYFTRNLSRSWGSLPLRSRSRLPNLPKKNPGSKDFGLEPPESNILPGAGAATGAEAAAIGTFIRIRGRCWYASPYEY